MLKVKLDEALAPLIATLRKQGLKITEPRLAILKVLIENHGPFSAEEIHKKVTKKICDLATVYRCLTSMVETDVIRKCEFGDGTARYELAEKDNHHHHHVICVSCKKVEPLDDCDLANIDRFAQKKGFSNVSHSLEFFGTCEDCK